MIFGEKQFNLHQRVLQRLAITKQPFSPPNDCDSLYRNTALDMLSNSVIQQLINSDQIQIVLGEHGIGKSCLCRRLFCEAPPELQLIFYSASSRSRIDHLFLAINGDDKFPEVKTDELAKLAARQIFGKLRKQQQPALLIDDAHLLRPPVLRMLFRFVAAIEKQNLGSLKLALIGERKLEKKFEQLQDAAPAEVQIKTSLLRPLSRIEIADYIEFRFESAGTINQPLGVKRLNEIYQLAGGLPSKIDQYVCEVLNYGRIKSASKISNLKKVLLLALIILAAIAIGFYWLWRNDDSADVDQEYITLETTIDSKQNTPNLVPPAQNKTTSPTTKTDTLAAVEDELLIDDITADENELGTIINSDAQLYLLRDQVWLQQQPRHHYVIQLVGLWDREQAVEIAQSLQLPKDLILFESKRDDRPWYTLLYGVFASAEQAKLAIDNLPPELRANKPWARRLTSILSD